MSASVTAGGRTERSRLPAWRSRKYLLWHLAEGASALVAVPLLIFILMNVTPGDAAQGLAGDNATPDQVASIRKLLGLNEPLWHRYISWVNNALHGDLGVALNTSRLPVLTEIRTALPVTTSLVGVSIVFMLIIGFAVGVISARRPYGAVDRTLSVATALFCSAPTFFVALVLVLVFALNLGWLPALGYVPISSNAWEWLLHMLLPALAMAGLPSAELARQLRAALIDELGCDYVLALRARGATSLNILFKHCLKNASIPVLTVLGYRLAALTGSTILVEPVFNLNGLGSLTVNAGLNGDVTSLLGLVVLFTLIVVVVNLVVDISYGMLDPRVKVGHK